MEETQSDTLQEIQNLKQKVDPIVQMQEDVSQVKSQ